MQHLAGTSSPSIIVFAPRGSLPVVRSAGPVCGSGLRIANRTRRQLPILPILGKARISAPVQIATTGQPGSPLLGISPNRNEIRV